MKAKSQSGVALVITLILLSVITFMAVTFLVVSRHEGAQVDTLTQQATAKNAAVSGEQQSIAQIIAQMLANNNGLNGDLVVSTNFLSQFFDTTGTGYASITNVNYYDKNGVLLSGNNFLQMLSNQVILPRAPVFVLSNKNQTTPPDFRYWVDLNRNGVFDTNGAIFEMDETGHVVKNIRVGDPEWVGILNHPEQRHSANNFYVGRYAFIALPIGNSLDLNYIHNQSKRTASDGWSDDYFRNQGVGSWELNLAGFLHQLNTNWDRTFQYNYNTNGTFASAGVSFDDATQLIQYRYNNNYGTLRPFAKIYNNTPNAIAAFTHDYIDGYAHGPLMTGLAPLTADPDSLAFIDTTRDPWSGDFSPNQYFSTQDLFNNVPYYRAQAANANTSFSNHLYSIGRSYNTLVNSFTGSTTNSYNRYTFYRLLSQMSFGSAAEPVGYGGLNGNANFTGAYGNKPKMNLNYANVDQSATNFIPWTPLQFYTNAADRMLRAYFPDPIGKTNGQPAYLSLNYIPVWPTNYYTPAVHRILQLAANIYDSVNTNRYYDQLTPNGPFFPSTFRPYFANLPGVGGSTNIYVAGYDEVLNSVDLTVPKDLRRAADLATLLPARADTPVRVNIFGVPYVIGTRSGFPSFNKFSSIPVVQMWRAMQLDRSNAGGAAYGPKWQFNVRYTFSVSNYIAIECWNPYSNAYPRDITIYASDDFNMVLTNNVGATNVAVAAAPGVTTNIIHPFQTWPGYVGGNGVNNPSFKVVLSNAVVAVGNAYLQASPPQIIFTTNSGTSISFENTKNFYIPQFGFNVTNRVRLVMVDTKTGRLLDYVLLGSLGQIIGPETTNNVTQDLANVDATFWKTNLDNQGVPIGFNNQVQVAEGITAVDSNNWRSLPLGAGENSITDAQRDFRNWVGSRNPTNLIYQVPLVALKTYAAFYTWAANDPLVHYTIGDLTDAINRTNTFDFNSGGNPLTDTRGIPMGTVTSRRYQPWNKNDVNQGFMPQVSQSEIAYKDPLVANADGWQFPTNKFPNVGWLGRVHRGSPWQTVYMKSTIATNAWPLWTGNTNGNDWTYSLPQNDWQLMDLFTTSPNDNASKGQLSINQTNEAAWAAVLNGVLTVQNTNNFQSPTNFFPRMISHNDNGTNMVQYLVNAINARRTNYVQNTFTSLGQILSVPELTVNSPYLDHSPNNAGSLSDAAYERIPQQIASLLRLGSPRYVIFSYGQSLKPADRSIVQNGPYFGMCTNYQITGEVATRTVVRIDNYPVPGQAQTQPRAVVESFNVLGPE